MTLFAALWCLAGSLSGSGAAELVGAGAAVVVLMVAVLTAALLAAGLSVAFGAGVAGPAVGDRAARARVPRVSDPDAEGRTRPRGPTGRFAAA